jgi:enterochelin esterase-like enzyme
MRFLKKTLAKKNRIFQAILLKGKYPIEVHQIQNFPSIFLGRDVKMEIFLPPQYFSSHEAVYPTIIFNDGQDMEALSMLSTLEDLYEKKKIKRSIIIGIHAGDRMQEYGTIGIPDYKNRGSKADDYQKFILQEILPYLRQRYKISTHPSKMAIAGFSLGGLSAFDLAWNNPTIFGKVGVFSGSFWWRSQEFTEDDPDANRIVHDYLANLPAPKHGATRNPNQKFWLQAGTEDEKDDRNNNGIIDAIDDTLDLIKALEKLGYHRGQDIKYVEVIGGQHNPNTWGKIMHDFLQWAVGC